MLGVGGESMVLIAVMVRLVGVVRALVALAVVSLSGVTRLVMLDDSLAAFTLVGVDLGAGVRVTLALVIRANSFTGDTLRGGR